MVNEFVRMGVIALCCSLMTACGSTEYLITTRDGNVIQAHGKPKIDEKSGMVSYKDQEGRSAQIQRDEIRQIIER